MASQSNIVYIITDQQRYEHLGCNGHPFVRTPHIDRLAKEGTCFERFYTNSPICAPSRAAIITGRHPHSNRVYDNGCPLPSSEITLPAVLAQHGYDTHAIGKLHLTPHGGDAKYFESYAHWEQNQPDEKPYYGFQAAEICTGHISHRHGHYGQWLARTWPEVAANFASYFTPHPSGAPETFRCTLPPEAHANTWIADRACAYLREQAADRPFFLHVGFPDPHHPFQVPEPWGAMYQARDIALLNASRDTLADKPPEYRDYAHGVLNAASLGMGDFNPYDLTAVSDEMFQQIVATTLGMVSFIDAQVGRIIGTLEELGLLEDTIVIFTTDHGDLMSDHRLLLKGPLLLEGLVRVPMIIRGYQAGVRSDALAEHIDIYPTVLETLGIPIPRGVEGKSLLPVLRGDAVRHRDRILVEFLHQFQLDRNVKALVKHDWKLIVWGGQAYGELYHLREDPHERHNLWNDQAAQTTKGELMQEMVHELLLTENILPWPPAIF